MKHNKHKKISMTISIFGQMFDFMQKITLQIIVDTSARNNQPGSIESGFEKYLFGRSLYKLFWATVNTRTQLGVFCL
jgi:hypothetical protein